MNDLRFACIVCGQQLRETHGKVLSCTFCLESEQSDYTCENRHYVCETCRVGTPAELIVRTCKASSTKDSFSLANLLMSHPAIGMAGPEHHLLVPAVLLSVAKNAGYEIPLESKLHTAMKRAGRFGLGSCASMGACGAAMGVAIATSLLTSDNRILRCPPGVRKHLM